MFPIFDHASCNKNIFLNNASANPACDMLVITLWRTVLSPHTGNVHTCALETFMIPDVPFSLHRRQTVVSTPKSDHVEHGC